ncbi:hypothetical protein [Helcococcus kunzii]|uniref:Uncharacterized protein n=1 Tax=Helcococcus kunzii ATCC 51366 TaxID=883114 RepID=H3NPB6_9FIRM|nr:hypothetical protein [Helcococcus kunzii]EHR33429.1 hypothetical protein HMPREF9709_01177 [Helcococcus kunzii ATCC 51366]
MEKLSDKLARLIDVKSIITIMLTVTFIILSVNEKMTQEFLTIYTVIISFYFGTQYQKNYKEQE